MSRSKKKLTLAGVLIFCVHKNDFCHSWDRAESSKKPLPRDHSIFSTFIQTVKESVSQQVRLVYSRFGLLWATSFCASSSTELAHASIDKIVSRGEKQTHGEGRGVFRQASRYPILFTLLNRTWKTEFIKRLQSNRMVSIYVNLFSEISKVLTNSSLNNLFCSLQCL